MDWTDFFGGLAQLAPVGTSIASAVIGPTTPIALGTSGSVYLPQSGQIVQTNTGLFGSAAGSSSILMLLLIGLVLIFALR
jgi:hypothetical protein